MTRLAIACIVEGHGEVEAIPVLLRRLIPNADFPRPVRVKRQKVVQPGELERYVKIANAAVEDRGGIGSVLLVLDADNDCAAELGPSLLQRMKDSVPERTVACAIAVRQYESWLIAGDPSAETVQDEVRGGKAWLAQRHGRYVETVDQPRLTARFDLERAARESRSFRHLCKEIDRLLSSLEQ